MLADIWVDAEPQSTGEQVEEPPDNGGFLPDVGGGVVGGGGPGFSDRQRQGRRIEDIAREPDQDLELELELREQARESGTLAEFLLAAPRRIGQSRQQITSVGDATQLCRDLLIRQVEKALDMRDAAKQNQPITGDAFVRQAILTILPDSQQRRLFLETASNPQTWPRLKTLFGAPPYHFLRPQDASAIRAAGVSKGRSHMAYQSDDPMQAVTNITQFGAGQLIDQHERTYRVMGDKMRELEDSDDLPSRLESARDPTNILMHVKVPKRSREEKMRLLQRETTKRQCFFPQPGEKILLRETGRLMQLLGQQVPVETQCLVKRLIPRDVGASTAVVTVAVA